MCARTFRWLAVMALGALAACVPLAAQDAPSVAEAAKRARQQKQESAKPAKVITNDTIPGVPPEAPAPAAAAAPGTAAPSDASGSGAGPGDSKKSAAEVAQDEAKKQAEIEELRKKAHDLEHDANIQRGAVSLDENTYYSDANRPRNQNLKDKIDREKQDLQRMEAELADVLAKLAELGVPVEAKPPKPPESITKNAPPQS